MRFKKLGRIILIVFSVIIGLVLIFLGISLAPVDRTPAQQHPSYAVMMERLDSVRNLSISKPQHGLSVGFAKVNLTPSARTSLAGYGNRKGKLFTTVHDSIYVRAMVFDNGTHKVAIVSADLLIIPPLVTEVLKKKLPDIGFTINNTYLGATHTHNSIGNWASGATQFLYGKYQDSLVNFIATKIISCIQSADADLVPASIRYGAVAVPQAVDNRLIQDGPEDPLLRAIEIHRSNNSRLVLLTYTAHATCLFSRDLELSRDYPGVLVDTLEAKGYDFAMFLAGAVGSHRCSPPQLGWDCTDWMAAELSTALLSARDKFAVVKDSTLEMFRIPLTLSEPQVKISPNWKVRSWLFRAAFGEYPVYINALRIGNIAMLGAPCDFSGEFDPAIDSVAAQHHLNSMVTSFNGGYVGYVTPARYYDIDHYETQLMNWYAPGTGEYLKECLEKLTLSLEE